MTNEEYLKLLSEFDSHETSGGVSDDLIDMAEATIGAEFPAEYRKFLNLFGTLGVGSEDIFGLGGPTHCSVLEKHRSMQEWKPASSLLLPISADGFGNYDCIDLRSPDKDHRPVVFFRHDDPDDLTPDVVASSFDDWFKIIIEEAKD